MSVAAFIHTARRELAHRATGGLDVTLYWDVADDGTSIDVYQASTQETISFRVPPEQALDAFHHPFAHLASSGDPR